MSKSGHCECHNHHCHCDEIALPSFELAEDKKKTIQQLFEHLNEEEIHTISTMIKEENECFLYILSNKETFKAFTQKYNSLILPQLQINAMLYEYVDIFNSISIGKYKNVLLEVNVYGLLLPLVFSNQIDLTVIGTILNIFDALTYDDESVMFGMINNLFSMIMLWVDVGNDDIKVISSHLLDKATRVDKVREFICSSNEKIMKFIEQMNEITRECNEKVKENISNVMNNMKKNDLFKRTCE